MIHSARPESPESVASHYDDLDLFYRELWGPHVHHGLFRRGDEEVAEATEALVDHLFSDLDISRRWRICDVGCGYGETARKLARETGARLTGLTVSRAQYDYARAQRRQTSPAPRILLRDWLHNRLPDRSFDLVYSIESSEHMPDLGAFFREASRVLKPGGSMRVAAWVSREDPGPLERFALLQPICTEGRLRLATAEEYRGEIRRAGLRVDSVEDLSRQVKRTWTLCGRRLLAHLATRREAWRFLLEGPRGNKSFALSLARIRIAYETGSMRYAVFRIGKPARKRTSSR